MEYKTIISIHALTGSATYIMTIFSGSTSLFQSTHPRGVRLRTCLERSNLKRFQSTHPRGVRPDVYEDFEEFLDISIHAPARGATYAWNEWARRGRNFNPRTHGECDPQDPQGSQDTLHISIHALTGSATKSASGKFLSIIISIHALTGSATDEK